METEELRNKILKEIDKLPKDQAKGLNERINSMGEGELIKFVKENTLPQCLFCQIIAGQVETVKVYESANILAVLDINPANLGHMFVMPKQHYQFITQLPQELFYELLSFVKYISPILLRVANAQGIDLYIPQGISQRVPHLMINIIPRSKDDKINLVFKTKKVSKEELVNIASAIKAEANTRLKDNEVVAEKQKAKEEKKEELGNIEKSDEEKEIEGMFKFHKERVP